MANKNFSFFIVNFVKITEITEITGTDALFYRNFTEIILKLPK